MCGIVGHVGRRPSEPLLVRGLEKLEYRGYDSAGLSLQEPDGIRCVRSVGNLARLRIALAADRGTPSAVALATWAATAGIGHTRWATHGRVSEENAHPHTDEAGHVHIVLNGIVENHAELRERLAADGVSFASETDAEVVAHLIARHLDGDLEAAVRAAHVELDGHYAFVALCADQPGLLVAARQDCPLVIGVGEGEHFVASSIGAFLSETARVRLVGDGDVVSVTADAATFVDASGRRVVREAIEVDWDEEHVDKAGFETYMRKEIHEQPAALAATLAGRIVDATLRPAELGLDGIDLRAARRVLIVGCGTSYHAGLAGRLAIEEWAGVPVEVEVASEFRHRRTLLGPGDLVVGLTQSGETADTLAALRAARAQGAAVVAITNVIGSQVTRQADAVLTTRAGLEIGVAATKTHLTQLVAMYLLALELARVRGTLPPARLAELAIALEELPDAVDRTLRSLDEPVQSFARRWSDARFFLFLGRHAGLPAALEGALKLKEVSYIPAEAYAAGEMKHGPIALLDETTPVVCVATDSPVLRKLLSNVSEVRARGASVLMIATDGSKEAAEHAEDVLYVPSTEPVLAPVLAAVPLQLLAYHVARARGLDVDQPRNLAKTVTVE